MSDDDKRAEYPYAPRYMRANRAAHYLDISRAEFYRWVDAAVLPPGMKVRGVVVWDRQDLDAAMADLKEQEINTVDQALEKLKAKNE